MIPKIIHYCWFGGNPIPALTKKCIRSWKKFCPDYEIKLWTEENFDLNTCPVYVTEAYKSKKWAFVSDYVRLKIVYDEGGIYLDTDVELIKSIDHLLDCTAFFGFETDGGCVATGLGFGSEKGAPVLRALMDDYEGIPFIKEDGSLDLTTCPVRNTRTLYRFGLVKDGGDQTLEGGIRILPAEYLSPVVYSTGKKNITDKTVSIHHYQSSWVKKSLRTRTKITRFFKGIFGENCFVPLRKFLNLFKKR
jgi:hypothetical protein